MMPTISLLALAFFLAPITAAAAEIKFKDIAKGSLADEKLKTAIPANGVLTSAKDLEDLCKAWKIEAPKVDFAKDIVVVGTTVGSRMAASGKLDDGNLVVTFFGTADFGEGFRYLLVTCSRDGVKKVNGAELK